MRVDHYPCGRLGKNIANTLATRTLITEETVIQTQGIEHMNVTEKNLTTANSTNSTDLSNITISPTPRHNHWDFFPTLPTIKEETNTDQRIVGGLEAKPGEIPWQVKMFA